MENSVATTVSINLDKERHMRLTLGGMKKFQEVTGKSLLKGFTLENMGEAELTAFIWACLVWEDKTLSLDDLGYMLDFSRLNEIAEKLTKAMNFGEKGVSPNV